MTVHHKPSPARAIEHAKTRDTMAHKFTSTAHPGKEFRSTRGFAASKRQLPAVDLQARHGGKPKGYDVHVTPGMRSRTSPLPGMLKMTDVHGVPIADAPEPLDSTIQGKHQPPCLVHSGMTGRQIAGAMFNSEDVLKEAVLAKTKKEN